MALFNIMVNGDGGANPSLSVTANWADSYEGAFNPSVHKTYYVLWIPNGNFLDSYSLSSVNQSYSNCSNTSKPSIVYTGTIDSQGGLAPIPQDMPNRSDLRGWTRGVYTIGLPSGSKIWINSNTAEIGARAIAYASIEELEGVATVSGWKLENLQYTSSFYQHFYLTNKLISMPSNGLSESAFESTVGTGNFIKTTSVNSISGTMTATGTYYAYAKMAGDCGSSSNVFNALNDNQVEQGEAPPVPPPPSEPRTFCFEGVVKPSNSALAGVKISPADSCGFEEGTELQISHNGAPIHWQFGYWSGDATGNNDSTSVVMDGDKYVEAIFLRKKYSLKIVVTPNGGGETIPLPAGSTTYYDSEQTAVIQAFSLPGYRFVRWQTEEGTTLSNNQTASILMDGDKIITAVFEKVLYTLNFTAVGDGVGKIIYKNLANGSTTEISNSDLRKPGGYSIQVPWETAVEFSAVPASGSEFLLWTEGPTNVHFNEITFTPDNFRTNQYNPTQQQIAVRSNRIITAHFILRPDEEPNPIYSYWVHCPVQTTEGGVGDGEVIPTDCYVGD